MVFSKSKNPLPLLIGVQMMLLVVVKGDNVARGNPTNDVNIVRPLLDPSLYSIRQIKDNFHNQIFNSKPNKTYLVRGSRQCNSTINHFPHENVQVRQGIKMGRKKDGQAASSKDDTTHEPDPSQRKHKKHKKKHKHRKSVVEDPSIESPEVISPKTSFKLRLKIGGETLGTKNVTSLDPASRSSYDDTQDEQIINVTDDLWDTTATIIPHQDEAVDAKVNGDSSDEERAWLNALEAGELDDFGEIPKARDPSLLTARQRALLHGHQVELLQLPSGYKTVELTEEQLQRRQQRAKKRRQQAHEKREKDKKQTLERLLKKQETKAKGPKARGGKRSNVPRVRYVNNSEGITLSMPQGFQFPFPAKITEPPKPVVLCGVSGCNNPKVYSCSKTKVPLCSLECYKKNLASMLSSENFHMTTS